jgi:hypothetical protein
LGSLYAYVGDIGYLFPPSSIPVTGIITHASVNWNHWSFSVSADNYHISISNQGYVPVVTATISDAHFSRHVPDQEISVSHVTATGFDVEVRVVSNYFAIVEHDLLTFKFSEPPPSQHVINGSFENGVSGWFYTSTKANHTPQLVDEYRNIKAPDGAVALSLVGAGDSNLVTITQTIGHLNDGQSYTLSFDEWGGVYDGHGHIAVSFGGDLIQSVDPNPGSITHHAFVIHGGQGDGSDLLSFSAVDKNSVSLLIDHVSVFG